MSKTKFLYWMGLGFLFSFLFSATLVSYGAGQTGTFDFIIFVELGLLLPIGFLAGLGCLAGIIFLVDVLPDIIDERDKRNASLSQDKTNGGNV